ncbi:sigma-70 family RNA polymerase sigma factor [Roseicitreum antarcticum]|uniref:RNA polymerase sigma factor n=1 Tax=Roseicitreum antarcticum TaxID=564137 RepID=A0A1H2ZCB4_9RHOB|nr:sigma-70 family RNA polymerase sigma factor [Roseicitreum antarcticum]SDX14977.1 RNA polymerase sigma-70 factor, ECF subfamily [Roseicitreum antarcticum]
MTAAFLPEQARDAEAAAAPANTSGAADPREEIVQHLPSLRAYARSLTGETALADDLVQETVLKAWTKFGQYREGTNLRAWLFTILRNAHLSLRRKRMREVPDPDGAMVAQLSSRPDHDGRMALTELQAALHKLPVEQREALILVGALGFTVEEASETCGCAPGTIKSRANRGRKALAKMLHLDMDDAMTLAEQSAVTAAMGVASGN